MRLSFLPILVLVWPLAEIAGFVIVGRAIGLLWTLGLVAGTTVLGGLMLRAQGVHLLKQLSALGRKGEVPGQTMVDGAMVVVASILLLLPGFLSDIVGLLLLIPLVRRGLWSLVGKRVVVVQTGPNDLARTGRPAGHPTSPDASRGPVIDLEQDDYRRDPTSPWSRADRPKD